jgi:hypothetical protein
MPVIENVIENILGGEHTAIGGEKDFEKLNIT